MKNQFLNEVKLLEERTESNIVIREVVDVNFVRRLEEKPEDAILESTENRKRRPHSLVVTTPGFHPGSRSSILRGVKNYGII